MRVATRDTERPAIEIDSEECGHLLRVVRARAIEDGEEPLLMALSFSNMTIMPDWSFGGVERFLATAGESAGEARHPGPPEIVREQVGRQHKTHF